MLPNLKRMLLVLALAGVTGTASAFSLLEPLVPDAVEDWQTAGLGYNPYGHDVGGPANLGVEYRWNLKTITYGFDGTFLNYFGAQGTAAVAQAFAILNNLPAASQMSSNLTEFPLDSKRQNHLASALGLRDLKSYVLSILLEQVGLANPERYVWTLRNKATINNVDYYVVIKRNFDPLTQFYSSYVNGALYTYRIRQYTDPDYEDAVEFSLDPESFTYTTVASAVGGLHLSNLGAGEYFTGLTRDDVGGLRYLYRNSNYNVETVVSNITAYIGNCPLCPPVVVTNDLSTNFVNAALRPGVDRLTFQQIPFDSLFGGFLTITNVFTDTYVSNGVLRTQSLQRVITTPDILFTAEDLGIDLGYPILSVRSDTANWLNNSGLNGVGTAGPGIIQPQVVIRLSSLGPYIINTGPPVESLDEAHGSSSTLWGWFDGTTNPPVVFPNSVSIQELEQQVLSGQ